jgi:hypothetical protein
MKPLKVILAILVICIAVNAQNPNLHTAVVLRQQVLDTMVNSSSSIRFTSDRIYIGLHLDRPTAIELYNGLCMSLGEMAFPECFDPSKGARTIRIARSVPILKQTLKRGIEPEGFTIATFDRTIAIELTQSLREALHVPAFTPQNSPIPYIDKADCEARARR